MKRCSNNRSTIAGRAGSLAILFCSLVGSAAYAVGLNNAPDNVVMTHDRPPMLDPAALANIPVATSAEKVSTVPAIDVNNRAAVINAFNSNFGAGQPAANFTGNVANCVAGTVSTAYQEAILQRANYFRAMVGLPSTLTLSAPHSARSQAAALIMSANNTLTHSPDSSLRCYTDDGRTGAGSSNLFLGVSGVNSIDGYIDDFGGGNEFVGHRRWILYPPLAQMGVGDIPSGTPAAQANALGVVDFALFGQRPANVERVALPSNGFWPYQLLPGSNRWSLSVAGANFTNATVIVTVNGQAVSAPVIARDSRGFGDPTIVFTPATGLSASQAPANDVVVNIAVNNITVGSQIKNFSYTVTVIDPAKGGCTSITDTDGDGVSDCLEAVNSTNPNVRDNNIFVTDTIGNTRFVEQQFRDFLFREVDASGANFWVSQIESGQTTRAALVDGFLKSSEYDGLVAPLTRLYLATYLRTPDFSGLRFWTDEYRKLPNRTNLIRIAQMFATAPEFVQRYGNIDNATYISRLYQNVLGRNADPTGLNFWLTELNRGVSRGEMLANFTESPEFIRNVTADTTVINLSAALLKRAPTQQEYDTIVAQLRAGGSTQALIDAVLRGNEYRLRFLMQ